MATYTVVQGDLTGNETTNGRTVNHYKDKYYFAAVVVGGTPTVIDPNRYPTFEEAQTRATNISS